MTAPVASGWSDWPGGACTHWKSAVLSRRTSKAVSLSLSIYIGGCTPGTGLIIRSTSRGSQGPCVEPATDIQAALYGGFAKLLDYLAIPAWTCIRPQFFWVFVDEGDRQSALFAASCSIATFFNPQRKRCISHEPRINRTPAQGNCNCGDAKHSKTNFVRGARPGQTIISSTTPVHTGRRTQVWQTRLETEDGKLVALVTQTQMVL